jgi:ribose transport system ATP-binding protein
VSAVLRLRDIWKAFPGVQALRGAELEVRAGEVHVLLGENGAGKSTLMRVLCGQHAADRGRIELDGREVAPATPREAAGLGLVMIHQELNLVDQLTVAENLFLGSEPRRAGLIDQARMRDETAGLLARLRSQLDPDAPVGALSVAQQQLVEIAKALRTTPRVLVMDEPSAALAESEIAALFEIIRSLCAQGVAVVYISHRMKEIFDIGRRVTVMRDGQTVGVRELSQTDADELIRLMVGRSIAEQIPKRTVELGQEVLRLDGLDAADGAPGTLSVRAGEILGVGGLVGSGRTELARGIFGAAPGRGRVTVDGRPLDGRSPASAIAAGVGFVTEDRKRLGLMLGRSVAENISVTDLRPVLRRGLVDRKLERAHVGHWIERLRIRVPSQDQQVMLLSGGNQQKVVIARWLAARCRVLLLDEPTRGIDVAAKAELYEMIGELVAQGVAILLISSDLPELLGLADRVAVMHEGRLQGILPRAQATQEAVMRLAVGAAA